MQVQYRKLDGTTIENAAAYVLSYLRAHPAATLSVGSDSQNIGGQTIYVTVIAFRHHGKGVHYIYHKRREPLINDMITRLFKEAQDSIETAEFLRTQEVNIPITIDVDYNEDEQFASHKLIPMVKGWILGLGYTMNTKQNIQIASIAADHLL
ncbi:MAG: ribonuclease H-like YkuK family protein [Schleiferiaceae bacterium]|nr:ribonuclease H-like YkuK family protein [Schleiferiaceae bacterium]